MLGRHRAVVLAEQRGRDRETEPAGEHGLGQPGFPTDRPHVHLRRHMRGESLARPAQNTLTCFGHVA